VGAFALGIAGHFIDLGPLALISPLLLAVYAVLEFPNAPRVNKIITAVLAGAGIALAFAGDAPFAAVVQGFQRSGMFFVLFVAVLWLRHPADRSPAIRASQEFAVAQPPARRDLMVALTSHGIGSVLNLAGLSLVSSLIASQNDDALRRRLTQTISQAFTAATCWTPFYTSMTMVLSVIPGLRWSDVAPVGFAVAALLIAINLVLARIERRQPAAVVAPAAAKGAIWQAAGILGLMFATVITMAEGVGMPLPIALGVVAPVFGMTWAAIQSRGAVTAARAAAEVARHVFKGIPGVRGETLLFLGANLLGSGLSAAVSPDDIRNALAALNLSPSLAIAGVVATMFALSLVGVHGVILVVVAARVLPPDVLQLPPSVYAVLLLAMWGIGSSASPVSPTVLYVARPSRAAPWVVSWAWNGPYAVSAAIVIALVALAAHHLAF